MDMNAENFDSAQGKIKVEVLKFLHAQSVEGRIRAMVLDLVNQALRAQNVALSNPMKDAISAEVLKTVLAEMLAELE